jgi:hypothetical protein
MITQAESGDLRRQLPAAAPGRGSPRGGGGPMTAPRDPRREALRQKAAQGDEAAAHDLFLEHGEVCEPADPPDPDFRPPSGGPDEQKAKGNPNPKGT